MSMTTSSPVRSTTVSTVGVVLAISSRSASTPKARGASADVMHASHSCAPVARQGRPIHLSKREVTPTWPDLNGDMFVLGLEAHAAAVLLRLWARDIRPGPPHPAGLGDHHAEDLGSRRFELAGGSVEGVAGGTAAEGHQHDSVHQRARLKGVDRF